MTCLSFLRAAPVLLLTVCAAPAASITPPLLYSANPSLYDGRRQENPSIAGLDRTRTDNIFSFVVFQFDVSGLTPGLTKTLTLHTSSTGSPVSAAVVALGAPLQDTDGTDDGDFADIIGPADTQDYPAMVAAAAVRRTWFNTNVSSEPARATALFPAHSTAVNQGGTPPAITIDVTELVDGWISGFIPNYGFALHTPTSYIGIHTNSRLRPDLNPTLTQIPEPGAGVLVALAGLVTLSGGMRRRPQAHAFAPQSF